VFTEPLSRNEPWYIRPSRGRCTATALRVHATVFYFTYEENYEITGYRTRDYTFWRQRTRFLLGRCLVRISVGTLATMTEVLVDFLQISSQIRGSAWIWQQNHLLRNLSHLLLTNRLTIQRYSLNY
jgi:hypothetical protein